MKRYICRHPPNLLRGEKKSRWNVDNLLVFLPSNNVQIPDQIELQKAEIQPPSKKRKESIRLWYSLTPSKTTKEKTIPEHEHFSKEENVLAAFNDILSAIQSDLPSTPLPVLSPLKTRPGSKRKSLSPTKINLSSSIWGGQRLGSGRKTSAEKMRVKRHLSTMKLGAF